MNFKLTVLFKSILILLILSAFGCEKEPITLSPDIDITINNVLQTEDTITLSRSLACNLNISISDTRRLSPLISYMINNDGNLSKSIFTNEEDRFSKSFAISYSFPSLEEFNFDNGTYTSSVDDEIQILIATEDNSMNTGQKTITLVLTD